MELGQVEYSSDHKGGNHDSGYYPCGGLKSNIFSIEGLKYSIDFSGGGYRMRSRINGSWFFLKQNFQEVILCHEK